ncbi:MAG: hypothetical protein QG554_2025 [Pseudomonadota bacterium]|nr:hypothetical protein [Pseudomonadota bacterium]
MEAVVPRDAGEGGTMNTLIRWLRHLWLDAADSRRCLTRAGLQRLEETVTRSEARHLGELRLCVEGGLRMSELWRGVDASQRAVQVFSQLRVWDTAHNNGVLIYLLLADRRIEILADRGLHSRTAPDFWTTLARRLSDTLHQGDFESGLALAIEEIGLLLHQHYPDDGRAHNENELPNAVVLL